MNELIFEGEFLVIAKDIATTKPNKETGEVKDYAKLSLFDRKNRQAINCNCYNFNQFSLIEENTINNFKFRVTSKNDKLDFWLIG